MPAFHDHLADTMGSNTKGVSGTVENIRVVQFGMGPIGCQFVRQMVKRPGLEVVGAVDIDPTKVGKDVGEVAGLDRKLGCLVSAEAAGLLASVKPDIVMHTTSSSLAVIKPQLEIIVKAGVDVITTCEEAAFPELQNPELTEELDALAAEHEVTILGTGINPGYAMDAIAAALSAPSKDVQTIHVNRVVDAGTRRLPLQRKIGAGLTVAEFNMKSEAGTIKHVGLPESVAMLAAAMGWDLDEIEESIEPVVTERPLKTEFLHIAAGHVAGLHQVGTGRMGGKDVITLVLDMYVGAKDPGEHIVLDGGDHIEAHIQGIHGDTATAAVSINAIPNVLMAPAGFLTMLDLPIVHFWKA
jgi:2,4-diaminopentanoate dehydrogenase